MAAALLWGGLAANSHIMGNKDTRETAVRFAVVLLSVLGIAVTTGVAYAEDYQQVRVEAKANIAVSASTSGPGRFDGRKGEIGALKASTTAAVREKAEEFRGRLASTSSSTAKTLKERTAEIMKRVDALKAKLAEGRGERRVKLEENARKNVENIVSAVFNRFKSMEKQLETISSKLHARVDALKAQKGLSMEKSAEALVEADAKLATLKSDLVTLEASLRAEIASTTSKESVKAQVKAAKEDLETAWRSYKDAVKTIRSEAGDALRADEKVEIRATTTATST